MKLCECGCGQPTKLATKTLRARGWTEGEPLRFINGHNPRGKTKSAETRARVSASKLGHEVSADTRAKIAASLAGRASPRRGECHPDWKGDEANYSTIHKWLAKHKPKSGICVHCGRDCGVSGRGRGTDWANISGEYRRDVDDYLELCRSCHIRFDRRRPE